MERDPVIDPLSGSARETLLRAPRPRRALPVLGGAARHLPLAKEARDVDRADRPIHAVWELTLACDLACRHCGSRAGSARPDELTLPEALHLVDQIADLGVREVTLIGGEVYLYEGWGEVARRIRSRGMSCGVVTGGRGFDAERVRLAREAGVQSIAVSIDGDEETHDRLRGVAGSYHAALRTLALCRAEGMQVSANTQVNRLSLPHLAGVFERIAEAGCHGWQVQLTVPAGRAADEPDVILQPFDLLALMPLLADLRKRCDAAGVTLLPGNNVGYFGPFEHVLRDFYPAGHSGSCGAGRHGLGIEANGDLKGCPSLPTEGWVGGNLRQHRLVDVWERAGALRFNRDRTVKDLWGFCGTCYYADTCRAGCTWMSSSLFGRPGNNPYCHHRALDFARRGQRERLLRVEEAPGTPFDHGRWELVVEPIPSRHPSF
ncbi:MAG TPA: radical SAM protein [Polyangiaceae bacterium]